MICSICKTEISSDEEASKITEKGRILLLRDILGKYHTATPAKWKNTDVRTLKANSV